jgi:SCY1-like protein 2
MKDHYLLPFLLPNVFAICQSMSTEDFAAVLPKLQPLFAMKDSPQNLIGKYPKSISPERTAYGKL